MIVKKKVINNYIRKIDVIGFFELRYLFIFIFNKNEESKVNFGMYSVYIR